MEKKIRQRLMMQRTCQEEMAFKEMRRQAEKQEEEEFSKMMMAQFAENDRIEQMNAQKRRMKQLEHKRAVEKMMEDRRRQRKADMVQTSSPCVHSYIQNMLVLMKLYSQKVYCSHHTVEGNR